MIKKIIFSIFFFALSIVSGAGLYDMTQMEIQELILCSFNKGGIRIPTKLCEYYMINHRITKHDIEHLSSGAGLDFILAGESPKKYKIAKIFISKGLDINGINYYNPRGLTPLHGAVLYNDLDAVIFLIKNGADTKIKTYADKITALELAKKFQKIDRTEDRSEIIKILSSTKHRHAVF